MGQWGQSRVMGSPFLTRLPPPPLCDILSGCSFFTGPWTVTRSSLWRAASGCCIAIPTLLGACWMRRAHMCRH